MRLFGSALAAQLSLAGIFLIPSASPAENPAQQAPEQKNMQLVGKCDFSSWIPGRSRFPEGDSV